MISQHLFGLCLDATRRQAFTQTNIDQVLSHNMVSLGHNELNN